MKTFLKFGVSLALIGAILWKLGGVGEVGALIAGISLPFLALVLMVSTADRALMTFKWARLLKSRGVHLPFFRGMKIYCAAMIWGMALPTTVGADAIRALSTVREGLDSNEVIASILIERMVGFLSALLLGLGSLVLLSLLGVLDPRLEELWWIAIALIGGCTVLLAASFSQVTFNLLHGGLLQRFQNHRIAVRLRKFHLTYQGYRDSRKELAVFFGLTFCEQLIPMTLFNWLIALSMGVEVGLLFVAAATALSLLISRIPIGIDGIGVFEGAFILLMSLAGVSAAEAVAIALVGRVLQTASWLPWWLAYVFRNRQIQPPRPTVEPAQY